MAYAKSTVRHRIDSLNVRNAKKRFHASCSNLCELNLVIEFGIVQTVKLTVVFAVVLS